MCICTNTFVTFVHGQVSFLRVTQNRGNVFHPDTYSAPVIHLFPSEKQTPNWNHSHCLAAENSAQHKHPARVACRVFSYASYFLSGSFGLGGRSQPLFSFFWGFVSLNLYGLIIQLNLSTIMGQVQNKKELFMISFHLLLVADDRKMIKDDRVERKMIEGV